MRSALKYWGKKGLCAELRFNAFAFYDTSVSMTTAVNSHWHDVINISITLESLLSLAPRLEPSGLGIGFRATVAYNEVGIYMRYVSRRGQDNSTR